MVGLKNRQYQDICILNSTLVLEIPLAVDSAVDLRISITVFYLMADILAKSICVSLQKVTVNFCPIHQYSEVCNNFYLLYIYIYILLIFLKALKSLFHHMIYIYIYLQRKNIFFALPSPDLWTRDVSVNK